MALRLFSSTRCLLRSTSIAKCSRLSTASIRLLSERATTQKQISRARTAVELEILQTEISTDFDSAAPRADTIPTEEEQATGLERREFEAMVAGNMDPFNLNVKKGPAGTKESPTVVPSSFDQRIVGCICEEDATAINWMILKKGPAQRCECGNFFQLVTGTAYDLPSEH